MSGVIYQKDLKTTMRALKLILIKQQTDNMEN